MENGNNASRRYKCVMCGKQRKHSVIFEDGKSMCSACIKNLNTYFNIGMNVSKRTAEQFEKMPDELKYLATLIQSLGGTLLPVQDVLSDEERNRMEKAVEYLYSLNHGMCGIKVNVSMGEDEVFDEDDSEETGGEAGEDKKESFSIGTPSVIKKKLDRRVIGQDSAKKILSVAVYNHYKRIENRRDDIAKSNIIMVGPSGVGKTELARALADIVGVPFSIADSTSLTSSGYVGASVDSILAKLLRASDNDIEKAQRGIVYIDEIDKIARAGDGSAVTRDVSGEGVQQELLKIIEGNTVSVKIGEGMMVQEVEMDTSNILFICGGAFEGITMKKKTGGLGFNSEAVEKEEKKDLDTEDIIKFGIIPELAGRLPVIVRLDSLSENELQRILTEPDNSIVEQYENLIGLDGVKLTFNPNALSYIARMAYKNKTGARGLRTIIEKGMNDAMFELPDKDGVAALNVTSSGDGLIFEYRTDSGVLSSSKTYLKETEG